MKTNWWSILFLAAVVAGWPAVATADSGDDLWPPMPGAAVKLGGGFYHSVPCACADRKLWNVEASGRLHFGRIGAIEAGYERGAMLLGGRFPSGGFSAGARVSILPQKDRWWDGLSLRTGYQRWWVMGMRASGTNGMYGALNWAVEVFPHVYVEADALASRSFRVMPHWELGGRLGVATRF